MSRYCTEAINRPPFRWTEELLSKNIHDIVCQANKVGLVITELTIQLTNPKPVDYPNVFIGPSGPVKLTFI